LALRGQFKAMNATIIFVLDASEPAALFDGKNGTRYLGFVQARMGDDFGRGKRAILPKGCQNPPFGSRHPVSVAIDIAEAKTDLLAGVMHQKRQKAVQIKFGFHGFKRLFDSYKNYSYGCNYIEDW